MWKLNKTYLYLSKPVWKFNFLSTLEHCHDTFYLATFKICHKYLYFLLQNDERLMLSIVLHTLECLGTCIFYTLHSKWGKSSLLKKYLTEKHMFTSISVKDICGWWVKIIMPSLGTYTTRNHDNSTYCHLFFYTVKCKLEFKLCFFCSVWSIKQASKQKQNNQTLIDIWLSKIMAGYLYIYEQSNDLKKFLLSLLSYSNFRYVSSSIKYRKIPWILNLEKNYKKIRLNYTQSQ